MARGSNATYYKRFYASIKAKKGTEPFFDMQRTESENYNLLPSETRSKTNPKIIKYEEKRLAGLIADIKISQNEFEGHTIESIEVTLRDHNVREDYILKAGLESNMGRALVNALLNIEDFSKQLSVSLYINKEGFNSLSVKIAEDWAGFKFKYEEYKPLVRSYIGKNEKQEYDWSKVTEFFKKHINVDLIPRFREYASFADLAPREKIDTPIPQGTSKNPVAEQIKQAQEEEAVPDLLGQIREERAANPKGKGSTSEDLQAAATNDLPF